MERCSEEGASPDEKDADQVVRWAIRTGGSEDEEVEVHTSKGATLNPSADFLVMRCGRGLLHQDSESEQSFVTSEDQAGVLEPERDALSVSPLSLMDTCGPSISSLSSSSIFSTNNQNVFSSYSSSSSSPAFSLTPPLPPSVELSAVLTDTKLTLDVYQGGAAVLPSLWGSIPGQLKGLQYLRLGSEDKAGLDGSLDVLPYLTELRSLAIRGLL